MKSKLEYGLETLGIVPTELQWSQLNTYMDELEFWNSKLNLVSVQNREELEIRHVLDCLAGLTTVSDIQGSTIADIGSGAGLPGLLLAIFLDNRKVTLIERSGKKAGFLRSTAALLGLVERVDVMDCDLKTVDRKFDIVVLRAFREFGDFIGQLKNVTADNGSIIAYKGRLNSITNDLELAGIDADDVEIRELHVPELGEERHAVIFKV